MALKFSVRAVAPSTGYYSRNVNDIVTQKKGWEISLSGTPIQSDNGFTWNVLANWSTFVERSKKLKIRREKFISMIIFTKLVIGLMKDSVINS